MRIGIAALVITVGANVAPGTSLADSPREGPDQQPPPIHSRTLDLLDGDHFMQIDGDSEEWVSEIFDTSRFTRIGLKAASSDDSGPIVCRTEWSFGPQDGFTPGLPSVQLGRGALPYILPGNGGLLDGLRDDIRDLFLLQPPLPAPGMSEVAGLRARLRCRPGFSGDFGRIVNPLGTDGPGPSGTLTDVKVLLRRY